MESVVFVTTLSLDQLDSDENEIGPSLFNQVLLYRRRSIGFSTGALRLWKMGQSGFAGEFEQFRTVAFS